MPDANLLPEIMTDLVDTYNQNLFDDPFPNEAYLHIGLVISQPFEDANHRTAALITNYNLLKHGIAPVIIDEDSKEYYYNLIYTKDMASLASLFKSLSAKEEAHLISNYKKELATNYRK